MKKRLLSLTCLCALLLTLCGGAPAALASGSLQFHVLPVTEAGVRTLYGWEGYEVVKITPYQTDFLVEYTDYGKPGTPGRASLLDWVFGATGRRVQLGGMAHYTGYQITAQGQVEATTTGASVVVPWQGLPETYHYTVVGDAKGLLTDQWMANSDWTETPWADPKQPIAIGNEDATSRYEQLYDARVDVDGLSLSFIPSGDPERYQSFFPAVTSTPYFTTQYDGTTGLLTLRLRNTALKSGGVEAPEHRKYFGSTFDAYGITYPYTFPAGSLGRDNHFLTSVQVKADGEDTVVTCKLTDKAYRFTVETGNLGGDNIPTLRLQFREKNSDLDK